MPLTPHYAWSETEASLEVTVDVPGVSRAKADVFATDAFLKVNCPPYLFALDLYKEVDDSRSSATILPGRVVFKLFKREPGLWSRLAASGDKAELTSRRNASIDRAYKQLEEARKARLTRTQQEDKNATQRSMDVDRRKRQELERRKAEELAEERGRLQEWQRGLLQDGGVDAESDYEDDEEDREREGQGEGVPPGSGQEPAPDHPDYYGRGWRPSKAAGSIAETEGGSMTRGRPTTASADGRRGRRKGGSKDGSSSGVGDGGGCESEDVDNEEEEAVARAGPPPLRGAAEGVAFKPLPPPRARLEPVQVSFTKLETGHLPARQQREEEIRAFRKQSRAAASASDPDSVDLAERQPLFLKDKGDKLFKSGNYSGAVNAYSRAIQLDDNLPAVRSNRAACRLVLGEAGGCVEDCDRALELLAEHRERLHRDLLDGSEAAALRRQLVRLLVRRAQAKVALAGGANGGGGACGGGSSVATGTSGDHIAAALRDYKDAMRLSPGDPSLESDYQELLAALQPADAAALRQRGDARFRSGDYEGAAEAFGALLGLPRSRVPGSERLAAFSNRAACNLVLERYSAAVADCDAGLGLLLPQPSTSGSGAGGGSGDSGGGGNGADFGAAAGEAGLARLAAWAQSLTLPEDVGPSPAAAEPPAPPSSTGAVAGGGAGLAPAAAAAAAARLIMRRGAAAAHLQHFAAAAADHRLAAELLMRLGEGAKATAALADAERMWALAEGREQLPPRSQQPQQQTADDQTQNCDLSAAAQGLGGTAAAAAAFKGLDASAVQDASAAALAGMASSAAGIVGSAGGNDAPGGDEGSGGGANTLASGAGGATGGKLSGGLGMAGAENGIIPGSGALGDRETRGSEEGPTATSTASEGTAADGRFWVPEGTTFLDDVDD